MVFENLGYDASFRRQVSEYADDACDFYTLGAAVGTGEACGAQPQGWAVKHAFFQAELSHAN